MNIAIHIAIALAIALSGCDMPERQALRIAISPSPGSSIFYCAQEAELFQRYDVAVQLIELNSADECRLAFLEGNVDAAVLPQSEYEVLEANGALAGLVMLISAPVSYSVLSADSSQESGWQAREVEMLIGDRPGLMHRRHEWQKVLQAYEHSRMLMKGEMNAQALVISGFERRSAVEVASDLKNWEFYGIVHQDSLLSSNGPFCALNAKWQGRLYLTSGVPMESREIEREVLAMPTGEKAR